MQVRKIAVLLLGSILVKEIQCQRCSGWNTKVPQVRLESMSCGTTLRSPRSPKGSCVAVRRIVNPTSTRCLVRYQMCFDKVNCFQNARQETSSALSHC